MKSIIVLGQTNVGKTLFTINFALSWDESLTFKFLIREVNTLVRTRLAKLLNSLSAPNLILPEPYTPLFCPCHGEKVEKPLNY